MYGNFIYFATYLLAEYIMRIENVGYSADNSSRVKRLCSLELILTHFFILTTIFIVLVVY